ncbi:MAG: hypothetical protein JNL70_18660 [Saprospiraceae bacterium]|nr:hypothetical protein [Saprospiraceae bacterium]
MPTAFNNRMYCYFLPKCQPYGFKEYQQLEIIIEPRENKHGALFLPKCQPYGFKEYQQLEIIIEPMRKQTRGFISTKLPTLRV